MGKMPMPRQDVFSHTFSIKHRGTNLPSPPMHYPDKAKGFIEFDCNRYIILVKS